MCAILCFCAICSPLMMCVQEQVHVLQEQLQVNVALYTTCWGTVNPHLCQLLLFERRLLSFSVIAVWCEEDEYHFKLIIRGNVGRGECIVDSAW